MNKKQILDTFKDISFKGDTDTHIYTYKGKKLKKSVSKVVGQYKPYFDKEKIAYYSAKKQGKKKEDLLKEWEDVAEQACNKGTRVHNFAENYAYNKDIKPKDKFEEAAKKFIDELPEHLEIIFCELTMCHFKHLYGGTCDLVLWDKKRNGIVLCDYKTNKDLFKNYNQQTLLKPFNFLLNMPINTYKLQMSLYQILLEQTGYKVLDRCLVWLKPKGDYEMYFVKDYTKYLKNAS